MNACKFIVKLFRFKKILKVLDFDFQFRGKALNILVKPYKNGCRCPDCGRRCEIVGPAKEVRQWLDLPVHGTEVCLRYHPNEIQCPTHGRIQEEIPWAETYARVTYRFEYAVLKLCQQMTQKAAAAFLRIHKSTMSSLLHRIITRMREGHKIRGIVTLGVDEIAYCHGHKYATIVYDLDRSKVVWIGKGKGAETLEGFFKSSLSEYQRRRVKNACCDMAEAFISMIEKWLPNATLVLDRFHIVKAVNAAMDEVRMDEWRRVAKGDKPFYKGLRWILFYRSSNRSNRQSRMINRLRSANNKIYRAWLLKDEFEQFWEYQYTGSAEKYLKSWTTRALRSRLKPFRTLVGTLRKHQHRILPFIKSGLTNAKGEGINRILQMVKQRASGFRNLDAFSDIIYLVIGDLDLPAQIHGKFRTI